MSGIIDPELTLRLGVLPPAEADRIQRYATAAFMFRGLGQADAFDLARGLHWRTVGGDEAAPSGAVIDALALHPPDPAERDRLVELLDRGYAAGVARQRDRCPPDRIGLTELRVLGWRLSLALDLLVASEGVPA